MINSMALVFLGGGMGASLRYTCVHALLTFGGIGAAWGIMIVNVMGSLVMGVALAAAERGLFPLGTVQAQLLLVAGVLGGFTTFSAFSADVLRMLQNAQYLSAALYVLGSVMLSLLAVTAGYYMMIGKNL